MFMSFSLDVFVYEGRRFRCNIAPGISTLTEEGMTTRDVSVFLDFDLPSFFFSFRLVWNMAGFWENGFGGRGQGLVFGGMLRYPVEAP